MSAPLRVLIVGPSLRKIGGQAVQAARLVEKFRDDPDVRATFLAIDPALPGPLALLQRIRYVRTVVTSVLYLATLLAAAPRHDVLHVFSASYFSFLLAPTPAVVVARLFRRPAILNYRSGEADDHLARWARSTRFVLRRVDAIVVPSPYLVDVFARHGYTAESIPNFVEPGPIRTVEEEGARPRFIVNRSLEPMYRVGDVLEAFARIRALRPDATLVVAGDGSERARLEARGVEIGGITFVGAVPQSRMRTLLRESDISLNASEIDNMPGSIIEAFAAGLPVVTSDAGGIPYIVRDGDNGLLVPVGDVERLADAALRVVSEPGLAAGLASRARAECEVCYTWTAARDGWKRAYARVAARRRRGAGQPGAAPAARD